MVFWEPETGAGQAVTPHSSTPTGQEENDNREHLPSVIGRGKRGREEGRERERERKKGRGAG